MQIEVEPTAEDIFGTSTASKAKEEEPQIKSEDVFGPASTPVRENTAD
jgi:hypothetical protein